MSRFCTVPVADPVAGEHETYAAAEYFGGVSTLPFAPGSGRSTVRTKAQH